MSEDLKRAEIAIYCFLSHLARIKFIAMKRTPYFLILATLLFFSCGGKTSTTTNEGFKTLGSIERLDPSLSELIAENAKIEILAEGFSWSEGPVWVPSISSVLYSDVPNNVIYKWNETEGNTVFLKPSGMTGHAPTSANEGSNGLILDQNGKLVLCQHGDRRMARFDGDLNNPKAEFTTIVDQFEGKRFSSPNDAVYDTEGNLYFTDPPYGLKDQDADELKEITFNGVYLLDTTGNVSLLDSTLTRPNGIALSPDEKTLYVANSDAKRAIWMAYDLTETGVTNPRVFFDATSMIPDRIGLPDGLKIDKKGNLFATGPGGVLILSPEGKHLGTILTGIETANCAFNKDQSVLYITAEKYLLRVKQK
jgi:gluconolactonase